MKHFFVITTVLIASGAAAFGYTNVLENGTNQIVNTVWDAAGTNIWVGDLTSVNSMDIINGGSVTNFTTIVGNVSTSMNNSVSVTGTNAIWISAGNMVVGNEGSTNSLSITDGGRVENTTGIIGLSSTATNNAVLVSGEGSVWENSSDLVIGLGGSDNSLTIVDGGVVSNFNGYVGNESGAENNTVTVSGSGSRWDNSGDLYLGNVGVSNNSITVEDNGTVSAASLTVYANNNFNLNADGNLEIAGAFDAGQSGFNWNDGGSLSVGGQLFNLAVTNLNDADTTIFDGTNKKLTLTGAGALWDHGGNDLIVGLEGSDNQLIVTNGGRVFNSNAYVGYADTANNNTVLVNGSGSLWDNNGTLTVGTTNNTGNSVTIADGGTISASNLVVHANNSLNLNGDGILAMLGDFDASDPLAQFNWNGGGTFSVGGNLAGLDGLLGTNQLLTIAGGSWLHGTNDLVIGRNGSGNSVSIQTGGVVSNANAYVGRNAGADSNTVVVKDDDSLWASTGTLVVGSAATNSENSVTVADGGTISVTSLTVHEGNTFTLGNGGELQVAGSLDMEQKGALIWEDSSSLTVGGALTNLSSISGSHKTLTLVDGGHLNTAAADLIVGSGNSTNNSVIVANDGSLATVNGIIGVDGKSVNNTVVVGGTNASWVSSGDLQIGVRGNGNSLTINSLGTVSNKNAYVGYHSDGDNNKVVVSGENALWVNEYLLTVGTNGNVGNSVTVKDGGQIVATNIMVYGGNSFNLEADGTLRITDDFNVSTFAQPNLKWKKDGHLSIGAGLTGITNVTAGRILTLDGAGAMWDLANTNILVGGDGISGSTLISTNGAIVKAANLRVEGSGNSINVEDGWLLVGDGAVTNALANGGVMVASTNGASLVVDDYAALTIFETLQIGASSSETGRGSVANGGTITARDLIIADTNSAFNLNEDGKLAMTSGFDATIDGFKWNNGGHLVVGGDLSGIVDLDGTNRILTIDGGTWTNGSGDRIVGNEGSGSKLFIDNGGYVFNTNATVGVTSNALNNAVTVIGSNSVWNNTGVLQIGAADTNGISINSGNSVTVADNGTVVADELVIYTNNYFNLNDGGTLRTTGDFDVSDYINTNFTTLNWKSGGNLSIGGDLTMATTNLVVEGSTNIYTYLDGGHVVTIDGSAASWAAGGDTNLIVGLNSSNHKLIITNTGTVDNANGFIGWGSGANNNSVLVSGTGSEWRNRDNLYIGGYAGSNSWVKAGTGNKLTVQSNAWVFVGDVQASDLSAGATNGGIAVASLTGAEMVVGPSSAVSVDSLYVGASSNLSGTVSIRKGGEITLKDLNIVAGLGDFNLEGLLTMTDGFDADAAVTSGFHWENGGTLTVNGILTFSDDLSGSNKTLNIDGGSWNRGGELKIDGFKNSLTVTSSSNNNSLVTSIGGSIGSTTNDFGNSVTLSGSNSVWQNSANLYIGKAGSGNSLAIEGGATNNSVNGYIGDLATASNNWVLVSGSNSVWNNTGNLFVGHNGSNSTLTVGDNGHVSVGGDLYVQNGSKLELSTTNDTIYVGKDMTISDSQVLGKGTVQFSTNMVANTLHISGTNTVIGPEIVFEAGEGTDTVNVSDGEFTVSESTADIYQDFEVLTLNNSTLGGQGTLNSFATNQVFGGRIAPTGLMNIEGYFNTTGSVLAVTAGTGELHVENNLNVETLSAVVKVEDAVSASTLDEVILTADGGITNTFVDVEFDEHFLLYDFALIYGSNTVSVQSEAAVDGEIGSALTYAGIQGIRAGFNGMQNAVFVRTKQLRRNSVATDNAMSNEAYLMSNTNAPSGAYGPGDNNTVFGMHFWMEQFSGQGDYDTVGLSDGFTLNNNGTTFGFDKLIGDSLVAGINYTYARSSARSISDDKVDTETYWLGLYSEWFSKNDYYLEGLVGLGWSDYTTTRRETGYEGVGKFDGSELGGHVEAGKYLHHNNWAMAPYAGLHYLSIESDAYTESNNKLEVDGQNLDSFESALGVKLRNRFDTRRGRFQTVGYVEWAYDFINEDIDSTLSDGVSTVRTAKITPDANLINAGIGLSWICTDYLEVGIGYDGRFNDNYEEHTGSAMFNVMF